MCAQSWPEGSLKIPLKRLIIISEWHVSVNANRTKQQLEERAVALRGAETQHKDVLRNSATFAPLIASILFLARLVQVPKWPLGSDFN